MDNKLLKKVSEIEIIIGILLLFPSFIHFLNNVFLSVGIPLSAQILLAFEIFAAIFIYIKSFAKSALKGIIIALVVMFLLKIAEFFFVGRVFLYGYGGLREFFKSNGFTLLGLAVPMLYAIDSVEKRIDLSGKLMWICNVLICVQAFLFYLSLTGSEYSVERDYMSFSYFGMFAAFVAFDKKNKNIFQAVLCVLSCAITIAAGCRGAAVTLLIFVFFYTMLKMDLTKITNILLALIGATLLVVFIVNFKEIIIFVSDKLSVIGFDSRTLQKVIETDEFFASSGREEIYDGLFEKMTFIGKGLYGDRTIVNNHAYVHNWILEILIDFGFLFGGGLIVYIFCIMISAFNYVRKVKSNDLIFLLSVAMAFVFGRYMVSASFLGSSEFMFSIFIFMYIQKVKKGDIIEKTD